MKLNRHRRSSTRTHETLTETEKREQDDTKVETENDMLYYKKKQNGTQKNWEPFYKGRALPFIEQGEGRVRMWDNPTIHGILCPVIIVIRRHKGAPNFYATFIQG